jgi:hypothetical protein
VGLLLLFGPIHYGPPWANGLVAATLILTGLLGLAGVNVFKGGHLDPAYDQPSLPPDLLRADRLAPLPGAPFGERWVPVELALEAARLPGPAGHLNNV